jgi:hypothetical protein
MKGWMGRNIRSKMGLLEIGAQAQICMPNPMYQTRPNSDAILTNDNVIPNLYPHMRTVYSIFFGMISFRHELVPVPVCMQREVEF